MPWRPDGLPRPTVRVRDTGRTALLTGLVAAGWLAAVGVLELGEVDGLVLAVAVGTGLLLGAASARSEVLAGAGWLAVRGLGRRHWVRTDRVVAVTVHPRWRSSPSVRLHDADGRRVELTTDRVSERLRDRLAADLARAEQAGGRLDPMALATLVGHPRAARARRRLARRRR